MPKSPYAGTPGAGVREPPPVRVNPEPHRRQPKAALEQMHTALGRFRQLGDIEIYSGVARASEGGLRRDLAVPLDAMPWGYTRWSIDAPPAGSQVLWVTLELASQFWRFESFAAGEANNTGYYQYRDFWVTWRWLLVPNLGAMQPVLPPCMGDGAHYDFYVSRPPGGKTWTGWWVHPYRSVTLTPYDKESDPNAFTVLLQTRTNGYYRLQYFYQIQSPPNWGGAIYGVPQPDSLYYSIGVMTPKPFVHVDELVSVARADASGPRHQGRAANRKRHAKTRRKRV